MRRALTWILPLMIGMASVSEVHADAVAFGPFLGSYRNKSMPESKQVIQRAIESGTATMGFLRRSVARKRLKSVNTPYEAVRLIQEGDRLIIDLQGLRYVAPFDGTEQRNRDPDGKKVDVSYRVSGPVLQARFAGEEGEKVIDFVLGEDQRSLVLKVTVRSDQLPAPIRYALPFLRE